MALSVKDASGASVDVAATGDGGATPFKLQSPTVGTIGSAVPSVANAVGGTDGTNLRILKTNTTGELQIGVTVVALPTVIYNGQKNVTTAGTRVTLGSSQAILSGVTIKAKSTNTGLIYVGDASVASTTGFILSAADTVFIEVANLTTVNLDSSVSGEGVSFMAS